MVDKRTPPNPPAQAGQTASTLWTVFLGTALLGLVVLPRRQAGPARGAGLERETDEKHGPASHEGAAADWLSSARRTVAARRAIPLRSRSRAGRTSRCASTGSLTTT